MKKVLALLTVALFATMLFSCDKDETATANTLLYNGTEYKLRSYYSYEQSGRVYIDAESVELTWDGMPMFRIISDGPENGTYEMPSQDVFFGLSSEVQTDVESFSNMDFTSGTVVVSRDDNAFNMKVDGVLKSGATVSFFIYVPESEWTALEY